jgi:hypothetical protein
MTELPMSELPRILTHLISILETILLVILAAMVVGWMVTVMSVWLGKRR